MAASTSDHFRQASSGTRPIVANLASPKANGASTAILNVATGWNTTTGVDLIMYSIDTTGEQVAGSQTDWIATLAGTTLSGMVLKAGTEPTNGYAQGSSTVVVATPTAAWADSLVAGVLIHADQDGTLKTGAVDVAGVLGSDVVTSTKILQNAVQADDLATNAITIGYAEITASITGITTSITDLTGLSVAVTVPAGGRKIKITGYIPQVISTVSDRFNLQIRESTTVLNSAYSLTNATGALGIVHKIFTPSAGSHTYKLSLSSVSGTLTAFSDATTAQAFILVEVT